jgi:hypothetical protein
MPASWVLAGVRTPATVVPTADGTPLPLLESSLLQASATVRGMKARSSKKSFRTR